MGCSEPSAFSPIAIFYADPASPDYGERIPFAVEARNAPAPARSTDHSLILLPSIMLRPNGRYAVVVTQRLFAAGDPWRPIGSSAFFERAIADPTPATTPDEARIREIAAPLLDFLETVPSTPILRNDVALGVLLVEELLVEPLDRFLGGLGVFRRRGHVGIGGTTGEREQRESADHGGCHSEPASHHEPPLVSFLCETYPAACLEPDHSRST